MCVIDSMSSKDIEFMKDNKVIPFWEELERNSLVADFVYSEGPHTEVGVKGLCCGVDNLSNGGSFHYYAQSKTNIFDVFLSEGYEVHNFSSPTLYVSDSTYNNSLYMQYDFRPYKINYIWPVKMDYFKGLRRKRQLTEIESNEVREIIEETLSVCLRQYEGNKQEKIYIGSIYKDAEWDTLVRSIKEEKTEFSNNPDLYVERLLKGEKDEKYTYISNLFGKEYYNDETVSEIKRRNKTFLREEKKKQKKFSSEKWLVYTARNISSIFHKCVLRRYSANRDWVNSWADRRNSYKLFDLDYYNRGDVAPSFGRVLKSVATILNKRSSCPKFIFLQPEEIHYAHNFVSWDEENANVVNDEFAAIKKRTASVKEHRGYHSAIFSYAYVDYCLEKFFNANKKKLREEWIVVITSDHGSSYGMQPLRNAKQFNNFYLENYHIPFLVWDGQNIGVNKGLFNNTDVYATILDRVNIRSDARGIPIGDNTQGRTVVHSEYLGPGFQDIYNKEIWFSAHDKTYKINYITNLYSFDDGRIEGIFDLENDPSETNNLINSDYNKEKVRELMLYLKRRWSAINAEYVKKHKNYL